MAEEKKEVEESDSGSGSGTGTGTGEHQTLKYHLLGPSLTKAGQDSVDQSKVSEIIYNSSKGSKYFDREEVKDKVLTQKIEQIIAKKQRLEKLDLSRDARVADQLIAELELSRDLTQRIVHVDCDAFYAAVELLDRPELEHVPFAVGAGVLTTCNYVARKFGCRSGMAGFIAKKLCPQLLLLPPNFEKYSAKASEIREILSDYDPRFESASIDEAYVNITEYCAEHSMTAEEAVQQMRDEIHEKTKVTVSAGIAANAKLAKICSNLNKPNGQYSLPSERNAIITFMRDLPTRKVNGIGRVLERELQEIGIRNCGDIYPQRHLLRQLFGEKTFHFLMGCYLGLGRTSVQPVEEYERKSVGTERTFRDISNPAELRDKLRSTAEELEKDMERTECKGRTLVLKVKLHTYEVYTRQVVLPKAICRADELYQFSLPMLTKLQDEIPNMKLRLMGLRCTHLVSTQKFDARAFFGLKPLKTEESTSSETSNGQGSSKRKAEDDIIGDQFDDEDLLDADLLREISEDPALPQLESPVKDRPEEAKEAEPELWDCPICERPQPADERLFNNHLDSCLSRQTIRAAVQREATDSPPLPVETATVKKNKTGGEKKRAKTSASNDPRQQKLSFG